MRPTRSDATLLVVVGLALSAAGCRPAAAALDLDGDGREEWVRFDPGADPTVRVGRGRGELWAGVPRRWQPWKLVPADVDGDGRREIVIGVHKKTRFMPWPHNGLFVFGWDGGQLYPRWLGSTLSRPFDDFGLGDLRPGGGAELIAWERAGNDRCLAVYAWTGFGFAREEQRCGLQRVEWVASSGGELLVVADGKPLWRSR